MYVIWNLVMKCSLYYQMFMNGSKFVPVFGDTHWGVMMAWWMFAPGSQLLYFLLGRNGTNGIEIAFTAIVAVVEMIVLAASALNKN